MQEEFTKFVHKYDFNNTKIQLKYKHSLRVQKLCEEIAKSEKLSEEEIQIASVIGLLHDYGRFFQLQTYHTYDDLESIDHGDYGAHQLFDNEEIKNYYQNEDNYEIIYEAIKYHNKYEVPNNVKSKLMCDIIRDADCLDILNLYDKGGLKIREKGQVSNKVQQCFYNHELINNNDIESDIDITIRTLCLMFKLQFPYSYEYIDNHNIVQNIYDKVENKYKLQPYFDETNNYVKQKIKVNKK